MIALPFIHVFESFDPKSPIKLEFLRQQYSNENQYASIKENQKLECIPWSGILTQNVNYADLEKTSVNKYLKLEQVLLDIEKTKSVN